VWHTLADFTSATPGIYNAGASLGGYTGAWLKLKLPYSIKPSKVSIHPRTYNGAPPVADYDQNPKDFLILGSKDDNTWDVLSTQTDVVFGTTWKDFTLSPGNNTYNYFAISCTKVKHGQFFAIADMKYFGTPGPTTLDKGSLSLGRSLDVPRVSRYDVDTETPRPEKLVVDFDTTVNSSPTDISGKGNHGTFKNDSEYSTADKAFKFAAANAHIYLEQNTLSGTSASHTFSLWINALSGPGNGSYEAIFEGGVRSNNQAFGLYAYQDGSNTRVYYHVFGNNLPSNTAGYIVNTNSWYHICGTLDNSGNVRRFYVNGELFASDTYGSLNVTHPRIRIGENVNGSESWHGMVSNFKLYSVALEPSEVKKLYRLGRTGRSMVISDTAVGIGKVPEAQLDVRGNLRVDGDILASVPYYAARQRAINSQATDRGIVYDAYVYTNYPGSFVVNSNTDGYYQPPRNGMYQVYMECIAASSGNVNIQRRTGTTVNINHCDRHWNYSQGGWDSVSASALIPITDCTTQNIRIYVNTGIVWSYETYHGYAYFKWFSEIPERRQHHVT
jgi:hypothetical protein